MSDTTRRAAALVRSLADAFERGDTKTVTLGFRQLADLLEGEPRGAPATSLGVPGRQHAKPRTPKRS